MRKVGRIFSIIGLITTLIGYIVVAFIIAELLIIQKEAGEGGQAAEQVTVTLLNAVFVTSFVIGLIAVLPTLIVNILGICLTGPKAKPNTLLVMGILLLVLGGNLVAGILFIVAYSEEKKKNPQVVNINTSSTIN